MRGADFRFVAAALEQLPEAGSEPFQRSIVNRLYYAAHHETVDYLQSVRLIDVQAQRGWRANRHRRTVDLLTERQPEAGDFLSQLRFLRGVADYEVDSDWPAANTAVAWNALTRLRRLLGAA